MRTAAAMDDDELAKAILPREERSASLRSSRRATHQMTFSGGPLSESNA